MQFIVKSTPDEIKRARLWWENLEMQWKMAYNEAAYGIGPTLEPPSDDHLMLLLIGIDTLRFAGPFAAHPNITTPLTNLSGLVPLYNLTYLSITHMHITDLSVLRYFGKLKHLFVQYNRLKSLNGIEPLTQLETLYVQGNEIETLAPIKRLTNLETIYATDNKLSSIDGLSTAHEEKLRKFYVIPNKDLRDREILRVQNELGIICREG